jgi:putative sigma-54 modulation protein
MNITFNFKNFEPSDHLKQYARAKFERLSKFTEPSESAEVQVNLAVEKFRHMAEVQMSGDNLSISAFEESQDMYSTIDLVLDKLDAQLRRVREKVKDKRRRGRGVSVDYFSYQQALGGERTKVIDASDTYDPMPMALEEAVEQLDSRNFEFLVFHNADTERINVIYRRKGGAYGLIDPGI